MKTFENLDTFTTIEQIKNHTSYLSQILNTQIDLPRYIYLVANWRGFCIEPDKYTNLTDIINKSLEEEFSA